MTTYTDKWKELGLSFDAIATGFLGSEAQIGIVMEIVQKLKAEKTFVVVDPVMGDHGHAYETYTPEMCEQMKELVCMADIVLPNVTECCILTDTPYKKENWTRRELLNMAMMLRPMTDKTGIATVNEQRPYPERSLITAIFFCIIFLPVFLCFRNPPRLYTAVPGIPIHTGIST